MSLPTARIVAPLSFAINFAVQNYGMSYASPNMKARRPSRKCRLTRAGDFRLQLLALHAVAVRYVSDCVADFAATRSCVRRSHASLTG